MLQKLSLKNWEELPNNVTNLQTNMLAVFKWALCGCVVLAVGLIGARLEPGWGHGWFVDRGDDDNGDEDGGGGVSDYQAAQDDWGQIKGGPSVWFDTNINTLFRFLHDGTELLWSTKTITCLYKEPSWKWPNLFNCLLGQLSKSSLVSSGQIMSLLVNM